MAGAVQCPTCSSFYNGSVYTTCPYCAKKGNQSVPKVQAPAKEKKNLFGFLKKTKGETASHPVRPVTASAVQPEPVAEAFSPEPAPKEPEFKRPNTLQQDGGHSVTVPMFFPTPDEEDYVPEPENKPVPEAAVAVKKETGEPIVKEKIEQQEENSLRNQISRVGRTVGKYVSSEAGETYQPVVGWLVSVKGDCYGQSFTLKSGINRIGRSTEMDVKLLQDQSVSRKEVASIVFDSRSRQFSILPGSQSGDLIYLDGNAVYERQMLKGYEKIEFGDTNLNMYLFVPFCGDNFSWEDYKN